MKIKYAGIIFLFVSLVLSDGCKKLGNESQPDKNNVPHEGRWGIYSLDRISNETKLIYSSMDKISTLILNNGGDKFAFAQIIGGNDENNEELYTMAINGNNLTRLTDNNYLDVYPAWSPDDSRIAFLSKRDTDLDIYVMNADGSNITKLYDSGYNDADINWVGNKISFTRNSRIWIMNDDGTGSFQITNPPRAGQWGNANLPFGDYDPRFSPDGTKIIFERLVDDTSPYGNYNFYIINSDGSGETALTNNGYTQGLASWSHSGSKFVYIVSAIADAGKYNIYEMNAEGTGNQNITPDYFPSLFLCHEAVYSPDDSKIFFIGEWWEQ
jgi:Tol biopolymer transport system component